MTLLVLLMVGSGTVVGVAMRSSGGTTVTPAQLAQVSVAPPSDENDTPIPATNAEAMGLQQLNGSRAPAFTLTDQHGSTVSLAQSDRADAVVLTFMDDRCTDICPIVARELYDAYRNLGAEAAHVQFLSINVNAAHNETRWLQQYISQESPELAKMPTFHYLSGSPATLRQIWASYGISVQVDPVDGSVSHSEGMFFIAPGGAQRYEATPYANLRKNGSGWLPAATITQWGQGIAQYARAVGPAASTGP